MSVQRDGDLICVLNAGTILFRLRETGNTKELRFVEEAYVHGFMGGEAVTKTGPASVDLEHFEGPGTEMKRYRSHLC
jgi:hypothetical protein